ncbi:MAG: stage 0 sporulation family protein [Dehalococcoidales bacterium]|nr:stage 0 sporulation family protein [Dehalococcoidales bacterium]
MAEIVGVRFKKTGKVYYFDPAGIDLAVNDYVVVETARGPEFGQVVIIPGQVLASEAEKPSKSVVRKANPEDIERARELEAKEREALAECAKLVSKFNLPMKLLSAEYSLDGKRLTFYFGAAERVDFRDLVRELANRLKVRVELRQTGPRDEAKLIGGCGRCGRQLCCSGFLSEFAPVSIRMAKDQGLPLNPMKISGCCGRLMCCLGYESDYYREMKGRLPKNGQMVATASGEAKVVGNNPLKETVMVELENQAIVELPLSEISVIDERKHEQGKVSK